MRQVFRYNIKDLWGDYLRAAAGVVFALAPLLFGTANPAIVGGLGGLAALFTVFGVATFLRHRSVIFLDDTEVGMTSPFQQILVWDKVEQVTLSYYTTRRDGSKGRMQLRLADRKSLFHRRFSIDSTLEGFETIASAAFTVAKRNGLTLSPATTANFRALGLNDEGASEVLKRV